MENLKERTLSFLIKSNKLLGLSTENIEKSWSTDLISKYPDGRWVTMNGSRVFVNGKDIIAGGDFLGEQAKQSTREQEKTIRELGKDKKESSKDISDFKNQNKGTKRIEEVDYDSLPNNLKSIVQRIRMYDDLAKQLKGKLRKEYIYQSNELRNEIGIISYEENLKPKLETIEEKKKFLVAKDIDELQMLLIESVSSYSNKKSGELNSLRLLDSQDKDVKKEYLSKYNISSKQQFDEHLEKLRGKNRSKYIYESNRPNNEILDYFSKRIKSETKLLPKNIFEKYVVTYMKEQDIDIRYLYDYIKVKNIDELYEVIQKQK